jgi:hypothetical protein
MFVCDFFCCFIILFMLRYVVVVVVVVVVVSFSALVADCHSPSHPAGILSIDQCAAAGGIPLPIETIVRDSRLTKPMAFAINASTKVAFTGTRCISFCSFPFHTFFFVDFSFLFFVFRFCAWIFSSSSRLTRRHVHAFLRSEFEDSESPRISLTANARCDFIPPSINYFQCV